MRTCTCIGRIYPRFWKMFARHGRDGWTQWGNEAPEVPGRTATVGTGPVGSWRLAIENDSRRVTKENSAIVIQDIYWARNRDATIGAVIRS